VTGAGLLHNMSVPPRSTVQVSRATLPGRRYFVNSNWLSNRGLEALRTLGAAAALALMDGNDENDLDAMLARVPPESAENIVADRMTRALTEERVPNRIGVFMALDREPSHKLTRAASLAVLARRSGPLYLPRRRFAPSLIVPTNLYLVFPEEK
jgi:muconolactone delta-isomerase